MSHKYLGKSINKKQTPQNEKIPGSNQVKNSAGGFVWKVSKWDRLLRFLILGSSGGTFYINEKKLTKDNAENVLDCLSDDPIRTIDMIVDVSVSGRTSDNDIALFSLALAASDSNESTRKYALSKLNDIARIGTHLFHFVDFVEKQRGWGRSLRRAIGEWYNKKDPEFLSYQLSKYQKRDGWSHKDLLRLSHPKPSTNNHLTLYSWVTDKGNIRITKDNKVFYDCNFDVVKKGNSDKIHREFSSELFGLVKTYELIKKCKNEEEVLDVMKDNFVQQEIIPTEYKNSRKVWELLYPNLKINALIRNLNKLSLLGILDQGNFSAVNDVCSKLNDKDLIKKSRIHPLSVLIDMKTYSNGVGNYDRGGKGSLSWNVNPKIVSSLDKMFYLTFDNIVPTGKRIYLAVDCSGSMGFNYVKGELSAREAAAALTMVTIKKEQNYIIKGFTDGKSEIKGYESKWPQNPYTSITPLNLNENMSLNEVIKVMSKVDFGGTNCAVPILDAIQNKYEIDAFVIYTDNESWFGSIHPMQALEKYRNLMGINSKLIVVSMVANNYTIADPNDKNTLDIVGFDTSLPRIMSDFINDMI